MSTDNKEDEELPKPIQVLRSLVFDYTSNDVELRLRTVIADLRDGSAPRERLPKDYYVQIIEDIYAERDKSRDQQIALAAQGEVASKIFVDITTGHEITKIAKAHEEKCSSLHGFMCDCSVLQAAQHAVDKARDRIEATLKQSKEEK